ncbi:MAG: hypothetical protein JW395_0677 [Nitrospira sp.]|nr:hypothetical protein [Nitrospira sp.]
MHGKADHRDPARLGQRSRRGYPHAIVCDNGPEFTGADLDDWASAHDVMLDFNHPGKPAQNAFIESFNGTFRDECLYEHWFTSLADAQRTIETWRIDCETERLHSRLKDQAPREFAQALQVHSPQLPDRHNPPYRVGGHVKPSLRRSRGGSYTF